MPWSGCQSTGAERRKYLTGFGVNTGHRAEHALPLTVVHLLQRNLRVMGKTLLGLRGKHKRLWLLRRCHRGTVLGKHDSRALLTVSADRTIINPGRQQRIEDMRPDAMTPRVRPAETSTYQTESLRWGFGDLVI